MVKCGGPAWWVLCALVPLMGGLLVAEHRASLPPGWHTFVQITVVLFIYSLVGCGCEPTLSHCCALARTSMYGPTPVRQAQRRCDR
jgi:uncharacterized membrane protein YhaH (DUF805 family)